MKENIAEALELRSVLLPGPAFPFSLLPSRESTTTLILMSVIPWHVFIFWPRVDSSINNVKCWFACFYAL